MFTVAIYLNDASDFNGGQLNFVQLCPSPISSQHYKSLETVEPQVGRCVLFCHDELHEGGGIQAGSKYMIQCDVLYERMGDRRHL